MKKQQIILLAGGTVLLLILLFFGTNVSKKEMVVQKPSLRNSFVFADYLQKSKKTLSGGVLGSIERLEAQSSSQNDNNQRVKAYSSLAEIWKDSAHNHDFYAYYIAEASKLVNSEKNLTFAARLMLDELRNEQDAAKRNWKAEQAVELFEKAIILNPDNADLKVGLGSSYVFGKGMTGDAEQTMKGIQLLLQVVKTDSANMNAQLMLGIGGVISSQFDKAIPRLELVVSKQPGNLEAISWLADAYAGKGDKENAIKWYGISKKIVNNAEYSREVDERIKLLK